MKTKEPKTIITGEVIEWSRYFIGYSPAEFSLQYRFRGPGPGLDISATADGDKFSITIPAASTANLAAGRYKWQAWLTEIADPANKYLAARGEIQVVPGFVESQTGDVDLRTQAEKIVDALEAALLNSASRDQLEYEITTPAGSRRIKYMTRIEQREFLKYYKEIVARERAAERIRNGGTFGNIVKVRVREK